MSFIFIALTCRVLNASGAGVGAKWHMSQTRQLPPPACPRFLSQSAINCESEAPAAVPGVAF